VANALNARNFQDERAGAGCGRSTIWWSQTGSNRRPHACKARALPTELWPRRSEWRVANSEWRRWIISTSLLADRHSLSKLVGLGRLELPTSRLSSARSNQLSYKPEPVAPWRFAQGDRGRLVLWGRKRNEDGGVPPDRPDWPFVPRRSKRRGTKPQVKFQPIQKGGDPAAGSPTATLLRLHPSR
jgi:hypothetical protein